jgi:hypothetical protein
MSSLHKAKDEACKELEKIDGQIEVQLELLATVTNATSRLAT